MASAFQLRCLGGPSLLSASGEQVRFRTRKHFALLVRLALEPGRRFTRDYLTDLLWPGADPQRANHSLAQGLSVIKGKVAREAVLIQRATVGLAPGWVDVDVHHLGDVGAEIAGPFLDGFEVPARPFEDWKDECRGRLLPQVRDCLVRQMDAARRIGDFATVERLAERLAELDPLAEEAIRGIMEARTWAGDRTNALKVFARYEAQVAEELGAKPGADLARMADLLREGRRSGQRPTSVAEQTAAPTAVRRLFEPETLVGREREFSALYDVWLEARRKAPRVVILTGDPGVGKTTLTNAFVSSCQMEGAVVARAQAYDAERELPFAILGELVKQLASQRAIGGADPEALSELTRVTAEILHQYPGVPKPVEWSPEITPLRLADAFLKTITAAAEESPVVLVVDDVHTADNASTGILHVVARKLADVRVLMILTGRTSELRLSGAPAALTSDSSIEGLRGLELDVLQPEAAERLVAQLAATAERPDPPTDRILRASSGNPLAIELLTREWVAQASTSLLHDLEALNTQPVPAIGIPRAIGVVFERQSRRLDAATRAALDLAAVLGRRLTDLGLYAAVDLTPSQAAEALSRLKDEGLLREVRGDLEFRNELIRAQAYYAVAGPARQYLHRSAAKLLEGRTEKDRAVTLEIAWHWLRGGEPAKATPPALAGSEEALRSGAPSEAEQVISALVKYPGVEQGAPRLTFVLAKALVSQSKVTAAQEFLDRASQDLRLDQNDQAEVLWLRALAEYLTGRHGSRYAELASKALEAATRTGNRDLIGQALFEYARSSVVTGLGRRAREVICHIDAMLKQGASHDAAFLLFSRAYCRFCTFDAFGALADMEHALRLFEESPNLVQRALAYNGYGACLRAVGRTAEAITALEQALRISERIGDDSRASIVSTAISGIEASRGRYTTAITYGLRALDHARGGVNQPMLICSYLGLAESSAMLGRMSEASRYLDQARVVLESTHSQEYEFLYDLESASLALLAGNTSLALKMIESAERTVQGPEALPYDAGVYEKFRAFRIAHSEGPDAAWQAVEEALARFRSTHPLNYLSVLAAKAWLERRMTGCHSAETDEELKLFSRFDLEGKRAILVGQGFLI